MPPLWSELDKGCSPPFLPPLPLFPPFSYSNKERRESYSRWEWDSSWRAPSWRATPSPLILYIRGQGAPLDTTIDLLIS